MAATGAPTDAAGEAAPVPTLPPSPQSLPVTAVATTTVPARGGVAGDAAGGGAGGAASVSGAPAVPAGGVAVPAQTPLPLSAAIMHDGDGGDRDSGCSGSSGSSSGSSTIDGGGDDAKRGGYRGTLGRALSAVATAGRACRDVLPAVSGALTVASPFLCLAACITALLVPAPFTAAITPGVVEGCLAATAAAMALTLTPGRVWAAATRPWLLVLSVGIEYGVAPLVAVALGHVFRLSPGLRARLTLLGCTNGGQASNLTTYMARGDVGLSVLMTLVSSLLATVAIPGLSRLYISGGGVSVDAAGLARSTATLVLAPLAAGVAVKAVAGRAVDAVEPLLPVVGIAAVVAVVLGSTATAAARIRDAWAEALAPALLLFALLFGVGYAVGRLVCRQGRPVATALAFEAGVKNPPLAFILALRHFSDPAVQTASAVTILALAPLFMAAAVGFRLLYVWGGVGGGKGDGVGGYGPPWAPRVHTPRRGL